MCFLAILIIHAEKEDMFTWNSNDIMAPKISQILGSLLKIVTSLKMLMLSIIKVLLEGKVFQNANLV